MREKTNGNYATMIYLSGTDLVIEGLRNDTTPVDETVIRELRKSQSKGKGRGWRKARKIDKEEQC